MKKRHLYLITVLNVCLAIVAFGQNASPWALRESGVAANLLGVVGKPGTTEMLYVAVGDHGTIVRSVDGGATWSRVESGTTARLTAVSSIRLPNGVAGGLQGFVAVGENGTILSSKEGVSWRSETSPVGLALTAVKGRDDGTAIAFGEAGTGVLLRSADGGWFRYDTPFTGSTIRGGNHECAVTDGGAIFVRYGAAPHEWRQATSPSVGKLNAVLDWSLAVGANGTIMSYAGRSPADHEGSWTPRTTPTTNELRAISRSSGFWVNLITLQNFRPVGTQTIVVGAHGTILRATSDGWRQDAAPTTQALNAVWEFVAVGDNGTIITPRTRQPPVIVRQPIGGNDAAGRPYIEVQASGDDVLTYLWVRLNQGAPSPVDNQGAPWAVGTGSRLYLPANSNLGPAGFDTHYQVIVANGFGLVRSDPIVPHKLVNLSTLAHAGAGEDTLIAGFGINSFSGRALVRAVGPGLQSFGVPNHAQAPRLSIYRGNELIATNAGWKNAPHVDALRAAGKECGAFPLSETSADSAILLRSGPGEYTAVVESAEGSSGMALLEVYDFPDAARGDFRRTAAIHNLSARMNVRAGERVAIGGLVVTGGVSHSVLIRVAGPALRQFGLENLLARPKFTVRRDAEVVATAGAWATATNAAEIAEAARRRNAFAFADNSEDAAALVKLGPGAYTIEVSAEASDSGVALLEVYTLPL